MAEKSPLDIIKEQMARTATESATRVGTEVANHASNLVRNAAKETLDGVFGRFSLSKNGSQEDEYEEEDDVIDVENDVQDAQDDEEIDYDDSNRALPLAFNAYGKEGNFEAALAAWKLWGRKHQTKYDDPDVIIKHDKTDLVFVGSIDEFLEFAEQNNLDDEWEFWGCEPTSSDDFEFKFMPQELDALSCSKDALKAVFKQITTADSKEVEEIYKGFHWDADASVTRVIQDIPYLEGVPLAMLGVAESIIYTAKKGGQVQTFIHELGEDSGIKPILYTLPPPPGEKYPRALLIAGGNMTVENKGVCD